MCLFKSVLATWDPGVLGSVFLPMATPVFLHNSPAAFPAVCKRQDPSILDVYGITKNGPADGKDSGDVNGRVSPVFRSGLSPWLSDCHPLIHRRWGIPPLDTSCDIGRSMTEVFEHDFSQRMVVCLPIVWRPLHDY